jgi:hypothetical protein
MLRYLLKSSGLLIFITLLLAACATTQLDATWKDPSYQTHPGRIMVIGVAKSPLKRRIFEDEFVRQLNAWGTEAIASYRVLPDKEQNDHVVIAEKMREQGTDTVLITRLVSKKTVKGYVPGTIYFPPSPYGKWPNYYGYGYQAITTPGYVTENEYAIIETNLYDANNEKLIWAATSETGVSGADPERVKSYIQTMMKAMGAQGLLGR